MPPEEAQNIAWATYKQSRTTKQKRATSSYPAGHVAEMQWVKQQAAEAAKNVQIPRSRALTQSKAFQIDLLTQVIASNPRIEEPQQKIAAMETAINGARTVKEAENAAADITRGFANLATSQNAAEASMRASEASTRAEAASTRAEEAHGWAGEDRETRETRYAAEASNAAERIKMAREQHELAKQRFAQSTRDNKAKMQMAVDSAAREVERLEMAKAGVERVRDADDEDMRRTMVAAKTLAGSLAEKMGGEGPAPSAIASLMLGANMSGSAVSAHYLAGKTFADDPKAKAIEKALAERFGDIARTEASMQMDSPEMSMGYSTYTDVATRTFDELWAEYQAGVVDAEEAGESNPYAIAGGTGEVDEKALKQQFKLEAQRKGLDAAIKASGIKGLTIPMLKAMAQGGG